MVGLIRKKGLLICLSFLMFWSAGCGLIRQPDPAFVEPTRVTATEGAVADLPQVALGLLGAAKGKPEAQEDGVVGHWLQAEDDAEGLEGLLRDLVEAERGAIDDYVASKYTECTATEDPEVSCSDGVDNDCDGLVDAADPDCETGEPTFVRGDTNADGDHNITDGIFILNYLYLGGPAPPCMDSADCNDDGDHNITDGIFILNYLYLGGPQPPAPFAACGPDEDTSDTFDCVTYEPCEG